MNQLNGWPFEPLGDPDVILYMDSLVVEDSPVKFYNNSQ